MLTLCAERDQQALRRQRIQRVARRIRNGMPCFDANQVQ